MRAVQTVLAASFLPLLVSSPVAAAALPLPDAPIVLRITDVPAFDQALTGGLRKALSGKLPDADPAALALKRTRVGGKLESQWALFASDLPLSWPEILSLHPSEIGFALLSAGDLEAVMAVRTPLAALPIKLPAGSPRTSRGVTWHFVSRGAGDLKTLDRRIGLAWARTGDVLLVATSERAMLLALDGSAERAKAPRLQGFAHLTLDMDRLAKDRYFRREFLFPEGRSVHGVVEAALRLEGETLVETREGEGADGPAAARWPTDGRAIAAAGWESDGTRFFGALRRAILEPLPGEPSVHPVPTSKTIPSPEGPGDDRYLVDITRAAPEAGTAGEGELPGWVRFLADTHLDGWGWEIGEKGAVRLVVVQPPAFDGPFLELAEATVRRRAGTLSRDGEKVQVGPGLSAIAVKRRGGALWIGSRPEDLADVPEPTVDAALVRWGRVESSFVKSEGRAWGEAEGAFSPDTTRPFSDRVLGLLGWAPSLRTASVERRRVGTRFEEKLVFSFAKAAAPVKPATTSPNPKVGAASVTNKPKKN
jgi:hypothetical protein